MKPTKKLKFHIISLFLIIGVTSLSGQESISWLEDFTGDITVGSNTYSYQFSTVDNNSCKIQITEKKTSKKGSTSSSAYVFYLNDLDLSALDFKTSGSNVVVNIQIKQSQKFILQYEEQVLNGYISSISVYMSEVDKARKFMDSMKEKASECKDTQQSWSTNQDAMEWIGKHIGESSASGSTYRQEFTQGYQEYLAELKIEATDSKGTMKLTKYDFNLSDIDPDKINLVVSGKFFKIVIPTRENNYFIREKQDDNAFSFTKSLEIYADEMELARNLYKAFVYLANNTKVPEQEAWDNYQAALIFVKENLGKSDIGSASIEQSLPEIGNPKEMVKFSIDKTDSKGITSQTDYSLYLADLDPDIKLSATSRNLSFDLQVKEKEKYILVTSSDATQPYENTLTIFESDLEKARALINALESAISKSETGNLEFTSVAGSSKWLQENTGKIVVDGTTYDQSLTIIPETENKLELNLTITSDVGTTSSEILEIYPEDIALEELEIKVSGKKMTVSVSTGKLKYVKVIKDGVLENYQNGTEILFDDIQKARNFIAAIRVLSENSQVKSRLMNDKPSAHKFLAENIKNIELEGQTISQSVEIRDDDDCKLAFTSLEKDSKGNEIENRYEWTLSDIDPANSSIAISGNKLLVSLITKDKEKLIKPFKNGEEGNFINSLDIQTEDVLVSKKLLGAFATLSKACE
jgi:hypothetical protein